MTTILILCTGNSCRSQMAHGILNHLTADDVQVYSAGITTHGVHPKAVATLAEIGIDISHHTSNKVEEYAHLSFDYVITVCDHAQEHCPVFFSDTAVRIHQNFKDPSKLKGTEEELLTAFAHTRDEITAFCNTFIASHLKL